MKSLVKFWWTFKVLEIFAPGYEQYEFREFQYEQISQHGDKYVTSGTLWWHSTLSLHVCSILCEEDQFCISFFHNGTICSGYSRGIPDPALTVTHMGQRFFRQSAWCVGNTSLLDEQTGRCYEVMTTSMTWQLARDTCQALHFDADLAVVDTDDAIDILSRILSYLCTGGVLVPTINSCYWLVNEILLWDDSAVRCNDSLGHLSSFPDNKTHVYVLNQTGILGGVEDYWIGVNDHGQDGTYKNYDTSPLIWNNVFYMPFITRACCMVNVRDLLWYEQRCYADVHKTICERSIFDDLWIGATDITTEGQWEWVTGGNVDMSAGYWIPTEPNGGIGENCAFLKYQFNKTAFADDDCSTPKRFICQKG